MQLRDYQQQAADAALSWVRKTTDPCIVHAPTGAGKSLIIAEIARVLHDISGGKRVLVTAPSAELVTQDAEKFRAMAGPCSIFSSSAGERSLRHPIVFGTPGTIRRRIRRFGAEFCAVVIDEGHRITNEIKSIIENLREQNPNLRVIALSATPYRLGEGYVYAMDEDGKPVPESAARDPYYTARVYSISERYLIDQGYLTPPKIGEIGSDHYETLHMEVNSRGRFDKADIDRAYHGHGRKTAYIVADVVAKSRDREGVMLFCATIEHAEEAFASLPPKLSAIVTGKTKSSERHRILTKFKAREIKYLVNVDVLTTGFDAPHVDVIALLRATESVSLLQQIIGRGLRIDDGKDDCIAEGQKILTDHGLVNIEDVRLCHKLWDGEEWVSHGGVICKGEREVITHDGLTATEDHKCWTSSGWETLGVLQQRGLPLTTTGAGGEAIKLPCYSGRKGYANREESARLHNDPVRWVRRSEGKGDLQHFKARGGMQEMRQEKALRKAVPWCSPMASSKMHSCKTEVYKPEGLRVSTIWRQGDNVRLHEPLSHGAMDNGQYTKLVERSSNRQDKQRYGVLSRKYTNGTSDSEYEQYLEELCDTNGSRVHDGASPCGLRQEHPCSKDTGGGELRGNTRSVGDPVFKAKRRVWDIINAGPRNRFTCEGKLVSNCTILDYAENLDRHCPDGDIFNPEIKAAYQGGEKQAIAAECPDCGAENEFTARQNDEGFEVDQWGYFVDLAGNRIETDHGPMPAHYGRRCLGLVKRGPSYIQCGHRWTFKECPHCGDDNDIAARRCGSCKGELIDPAEKLRIEFKAMKRDPTRIQTDRVIDWSHKPTMTRKGNECIVVTYTTEYRSFTVWYHPYIKGGKLLNAWLQLNDATQGLTVMPESVTYQKSADTGFYEVYSYGEPADEIPS